MGKSNVSIADPNLVHVPPSQQTVPGPVPKPGELLPLVAEDFAKQRREAAKERDKQVSKK